MPQQFLLPCSCGQKIRIANSQAGGQVNCVCGQTLSVPTLRGIRQLEIAPASTPLKAAPGWTRVHGAFFASGLVLATIGVALIVFYLYRYAQIGGLAVDRSDDVIKAMSAQLDTLNPTQALEMWSHEILEEGLGEPQAPFWIAAKTQIAEYFLWIKFGGAAFLTGVAMSLGALFIGRRSAV
jgi:hypothetical protein